MSEATGSVWKKLADLPKPTLAQLFAEDPARLDKLATRFDLGEQGIRFDWSKTHLDDAHIAAFEQLAQVAGFDEHRRALFAGEIVNPTEGRAAEHTAQRGVGKDESVALAHGYHSRMAAVVEAIHQGAMGDVRHLIHIGIGGSALGPALAVSALARDGAMVDVHVVSNIDGTALEAAFDACDPATTMLAIASKTFTTTETMVNAASAIEWLQENGVTDPYGRVVALTASPEKAVEWGVDETRILPFSESVGGRYSLWSSIGFPVAMALGWPDFAELLEGAATIDRHFRDADGAANLPLRAAFADQYYTRLRGCQTRGVFAYDERLALLPDYLQQLEMESNGKSVKADGSPVDGPTAPITWGGVGTDAQHAVFQLLHQGTNLVPVDFIAAIVPGHDLDPAHHRILLSNCFAQGAALMAGKPSDDPARAYPGDRPSATILLDEVSPASFGALIAFHEHRTFANAVLMGINPFDQFGVELGKEIAKQIEKGGTTFDPSTEALLELAGIA
ncbi:glucose-6-phosphate isomerase [Novosphingobium chloroacetimidivorans]|uniref:Glucose-6-phosphate isomerase n=1 Tax=Novosphingobium chloroacetimidivorans TaxID=1428314 RepID=A0A7W7KBH9_9SPHN|nr:glucose-6-phosphate isomerase [Novosphingobium chloroacetimidivorans]MBB4859782.1 glucose-6-phosphate isomerase [Novosphingobium chloroacetimidivorans]